MNGDLSDYIRFGFLKPGKDVFAFESSGSEHLATLLSDGSLMDEDKRKHNDIYTWYLKYAEPPFNYKVKYKGVMFDLYQRYMKLIRSTIEDLRREEEFRLKELGSKELLNSDRAPLHEYMNQEKNADINEISVNSSPSDKISTESDCTIFSNTSSAKSDQSPDENDTFFNYNNNNNNSTKRKSEIATEFEENNNNNKLNYVHQHITLLDGLNTGVFKPGKDVITVKYNGIKYTASLTSEGNISYENDEFSNPSRWVMHIYRKVNPNRKSVSGWKVICYNGIPIIKYVQDIEERLEKMNNVVKICKKRKTNNRYNNNEDDNVILEDDNDVSTEEYENNNENNKQKIKFGNSTSKRQQQQQHNNNKKNTSNTNTNTPNTVVQSNNNNTNNIIINEDPEPIELQTIQLKPFIEKGILTPGVDILEYIYNGINCRASLMNNGKIRDANFIKYLTPTEWGNAVLDYYDIKNRLNHWDRIKYDSKPIVHYYNLLLNT